MSVPLPYDIVYCTSEDPQHPISQLAGDATDAKAGDASLRGWQSARHGKSPQTLVLRFPGNVWLQQLRILSHESKIATKVEVRVAKLTKDDDWGNPPSFRNVRFVKLGSVDFNSNEQSHYKSKERKTVHLKTEAYFLKLLFGRPYINALNPSHQIGIYSLECSGRVVETVVTHADEQVILGGTSQSANFALPPPKDRRLSISSVASQPPAVTHVPDRNVGGSSAPCEASGGRPLRIPGFSTSPIKSALSSNGSGPLQASLSSAFRSVRILEFEDFFLRRSEELVSLKEEAVAVEDFAMAAECRDKLALLNKRAKEIYELEQDKVQAIIDENFEVAQQVKVRMNELVGLLFTQSALPVPGASDKLPDNAAPHEEPDSKVPHVPAAPQVEAPPNRNIHAKLASLLSSSSRSSDSANADSQSVASEAIEATEEAQQVIDADTLPSPERNVARAILFCTDNEESPSVTLPSPGFDIQPLISAVGRFPAACLLSRRFKLREAALVVITEQLDLLSMAPASVEDAVLRFLDHNSYGLQDSIPNVVFAACAFIRMALGDTSGCIGSVLSPLVALLPRLLTRCSDNLQRIRDEALATLTLYVKTPAIPASCVLSATLMEPMDKERRKLPFTNAKAQLSRLNLLQLVVEQGRVHLEGNATLSDNLLQKLLLPAVNHPNPEVRDLATSILGRLVSARQMTVSDKDLARIINAGIRDGITNRRA
ncbi:hypothetical protein ABL78_4069 [Leptomonas seymouri]|uniref:Centrosomal protein CEP104 N-terminal domain-containing protein n=1 Tax=Leptomonas seymouri TaxID=5684 RepID=A0A0N0P5U7_LEPSE|nr:hypothetical protein ABL78_4069 [Leptomonas seymouri]|eukprot:KPI86879.1 hypothetical protein ABL78_4069 [Leptomonas seymouri]